MKLIKYIILCNIIYYIGPVSYTKLFLHNKKIFCLSNYIFFLLFYYHLLKFEFCRYY